MENQAKHSHYLLFRPNVFFLNYICQFHLLCNHFISPHQPKECMKRNPRMLNLVALWGEFRGFQMWLCPRSEKQAPRGKRMYFRWHSGRARTGPQLPLIHFRPHITGWYTERKSRSQIVMSPFHQPSIPHNHFQKKNELVVLRGVWGKYWSKWRKSSAPQI